MRSFLPGYAVLLEGGQLEKRAEQAFAHLAVCDVCAWECPVDRTAGKIGVCQTGLLAKVSSYGAHHGEEAPLRGWRGSGTIFFTRCNLRCQYCQNHDISQTDAGTEVRGEELAGIMLKLQAAGCHNINFVSPSHVVPQIIEAIYFAARSGLRLPLVYNTGGYDSLSMLRLLDGIVDIYMPDMKYGEAEAARAHSKVRDYPKVNQAAVREMHRQVGDLIIGEDGLARRGLLVRHLVLPNSLAGTAEVVRFLAGEISRDTYLNLMDQYRPEHKAHLIPRLDRRITAQEYAAARALARQAGLHRLDHERSNLW